MALLVLKYHESPILIEALDRQYHCFLETYDQQYAHLSQQKENLLNDLKKEMEINEPNFFLQLLSLLIYQTEFVQCLFYFPRRTFMEGILAAGIKRLPGKTCLLLTYRTNRSFHYFFRKNRYLDFQFPAGFSRYPYRIHFFYSYEK